MWTDFLGCVLEGMRGGKNDTLEDVCQLWEVAEDCLQVYRILLRMWRSRQQVTWSLIAALSKKLINRYPEWIHQFLWRTKIQVILNHWTWPGSSQRNPPPGTSIFICPILTLPLLFLGLVHVGTFLSPAIYCFIKKQRARQGFCIDRGRRGAGCLQLLNLLFYLLKQKESLHRHSMLVFIFFNIFVFLFIFWQIVLGAHFCLLLWKLG